MKLLFIIKWWICKYNFIWDKLVSDFFIIKCCGDKGRYCRKINIIVIKLIKLSESKERSKVNKGYIKRFFVREI